MLPYYWRFPRTLISTADAIESENIILNSLHKFSPVPRDLNKNIYFSEPIISDLPVVDKLKSALIYQNVGYVAIMNPPGCSTPRHIDHISRSTLIYIPLFPRTGYTRTLYYDDETTDLLATTTEYNDMMPVLMNTQIYHAIEYTLVRRVSLQINICLPIEQVVEMWNTNKLFHLGKLP
jgi:hypothetical protein